MFEGTVRLAGDSSSLKAVLLVGDNRLTVKTSHHEIGDWELSELFSRMRSDGCHIVAEGEELIVTVDEPMRLAEAIGPSVANPGDGSLLRTDPRPEQHWPGRWQRLAGIRLTGVPMAAKLTLVALVTAGGLFITAPVVLIALMMAAGLVGLIAGGYALMDPFMAVRLPDPLTPQWLIRGGAATLALAIALAVVT